jgi:4'-phosphopantetheinyl transferase
MSADANVDIWFRETSSLDEAVIAADVSILSPHELARYRRFHFAHDARDYAAAHALLRTMLSQGRAVAPRDWQFDTTPSGKPFLRDADATGDASFSLSHTRGMVACAVTRDADVGIDVESIDRDVHDRAISVRFFAASERDALARLAPEIRRRRFFDLWTLKEAILKATGLGLAQSLDRFVFDVDALIPGREIIVTGPPDPAAHQWQFELFTPGRRFRGAVAIRRRGGPPLRVTIRPSTGQA